MLRANEKEFDIFGDYNNIEEFKRATNGLRLMFDHKPKDEDPYKCSIRRRKFGPVVLAEMTSDRCVGSRRIENSAEQDNFICITNQVRGSMQQCQRTRSFDVSDNDLYVWDAHVPVTFDVQTEIEVKTLWIHRPMVDMMSVTNDTDFFQKVPHENPVRNILYRQTLDFHEIADKLNYSQILRIVKSIIETLHCCFDKHDLEYRANYYDVYAKSVNYIRDNIDNIDLSLGNLSHFTNIGVRSIQRAFAASGTTFGVFVRQERLREASRLLTLSEARHLSLTDLAHRFSFYDLAHFSRAFKSKFGCSPKEFRLRFNQ